MSSELREFLSEWDLCEICILRYVDPDSQNFDEIQKSAHIVTSDSDGSKRPKSAICIACLGIFQLVDKVAEEILESTRLDEYECNSLYTSISIPVAVLLRELSIWIALIEKFPETINKDIPRNISIKDVFKNLLNKRLCQATNRTVEHNQNGILVNLFFEYDQEKEEVDKLFSVTPQTLVNKKDNRKAHKNQITRNFFEKHYYPKNIDLEDYKKHISVPPQLSSSLIKFVRFTVDGPTVFLAGRYRKLSRDLCQTPWILKGIRMKEDSIQELITRQVNPYFGHDVTYQNDQVIFIGSGREDTDVRCLGKGRPFVLQIADSRKSTISKQTAAQLESQIEQCKRVSVQHLQLVKREELVHIKSGEEEKKKFYRALCVLNTPATSQLIDKLNIPDGFLVQQKTPLRVLHRRPLLTRPRQIFTCKAFMHKENPNLVIIDVVTQAGAYIKELVHGEFGRTSPSIASIIGQDIDIISLDVNAIDLNWPPEVNNQLN